MLLGLEVGSFEPVLLDSESVDALGDSFFEGFLVVDALGQFGEQGFFLPSVPVLQGLVGHVGISSLKSRLTVGFANWILDTPGYDSSSSGQDISRSGNMGRACNRFCPCLLLGPQSGFGLYANLKIRPKVVFSPILI